MRLNRARLTVRGMIGLIAAIGVALFVAREFWEGLPPRFVVDGIPGRIGRLRPGMTWEQTRDILGLETSWLRGGTDARFHVGGGDGHSAYENYCVRPLRDVVVKASIRGGPPEPVRIHQSSAAIYLRFRTVPESKNWRTDPSTRLVHASFSSGFKTIAEMPRTR